LLASQRRITPKYLRELVEGIPSTQALRTLKNSQTDYDKKVGKHRMGRAKPKEIGMNDVLEWHFGGGLMIDD